MLFKQPVLERIAKGEITLAFRRWQRPSVKAGGTLLTPVGQLAIAKVEEIALDKLSRRDALLAGYDDLESLRNELARSRPGTLYRIRFRLAGADPRIKLREDDRLSADDLQEIVERLDRLDRRSAVGPWTRKVLGLIARYPERRAAELAEQSNFEKEWLKLHVRKLKNLGLTESLHPGYRLSPRGEAIWESLPT